MEIYKKRRRSTKMGMLKNGNSNGLLQGNGAKSQKFNAKGPVARSVEVSFNISTPPIFHPAILGMDQWWGEIPMKTTKNGLLDNVYPFFFPSVSAPCV